MRRRSRVPVRRLLSVALPGVLHGALIGPAAARSAGAEPGVVLDAGDTRVELVPAPAGLEVRFQDAASGADLGGAEIAGPRAVLGLGERRVRIDLQAAAGSSGGPVFRGAIDLAGPEGFTATILFRRGGEPRVLRFPPLVAWPPYLTGEPSHAAGAHGHVTPHDGRVEVVPGGHVELALEEGRLRLHAYDAGMRPRAATPLAAEAILEPCSRGSRRLVLAPPAGSARPSWLEAEFPIECLEARRILLRVRAGAEERSFRYPLGGPLRAELERTPRILAAVEADGVRVELRQAARDTGFPGPSALQIRLFDANSRFPLEPRELPRLRLRSAQGATRALPAPLREALAGRFRLEPVALPPGAALSLDVEVRVEQGSPPARAALGFATAPARRGVSWPWLAVSLGAGLAVLRRWRRQGERTSRLDLVRFLGLEALLGGRAWPAALQWPLLLVLALATLRLLTGPSDPGSNPGATLLLGLVLPLVLLSTVLVGRLWCALCPFPLLADTASGLASAGTPRLAPSRRRGGLVAAGLLLLLPAASLAAPVPGAAPVLGALMVLGLALAIGLALRHDGRAFCRIACPVGASLAVLAMASPARLRSARQGATDPEGDPAPDPCPDGLAPQQGDLASQCSWCGRCFQARPRGTWAADLVPPFAELGGRPGQPPALAGTLAPLLLALFTLLLVAGHPLWVLLGPPTAACLAGIPLLLCLGACLVARRRAGGLPGTAAYSPLAAAAAWSWALGCLPSPASLGGLVESLLSGARVQASPPPFLEPGALLACRLGLLATGSLLSILAIFRGSRPVTRPEPPAVRCWLPHVLALAVLGAGLAALVATAFHLGWPSVA